MNRLTTVLVQQTLRGARMTSCCCLCPPSTSFRGNHFTHTAVRVRPLKMKMNVTSFRAYSSKLEKVPDEYIAEFLDTDGSRDRSIKLHDEHGLFLSVILHSEAHKQAIERDMHLVKMRSVGSDQSDEDQAPGSSIESWKLSKQPAKSDTNAKPSKKRTKKIRLNCTIDKADLTIKLNKIIKLLEDGHPVRIDISSNSLDSVRMTSTTMNVHAFLQKSKIARVQDKPEFMDETKAYIFANPLKPKS